jgi:hypothetical protein
MRFGLVVHGPEVIDSGIVQKVLDRLAEKGEVLATLGGAMGLAAVMDAGLEGRLTIVPRQLVSDALLDMDRAADVVVLLNRAKSRESGLAFGRMVVGRSLSELGRPLVQLDDGFFIIWKEGNIGPLAEVIEDLGLEPLPRPDAVEDRGDRRSLHGVRPGENIWINGTVVGRATSSEVAVRLKDGKLLFENVVVKDHGLDKVKVADLRKAIIRSGSVRRTSAAVRTALPPESDRLILVDHRAEDAIFRARGARAAVTVGDDTTCISASLLARLGVPVVGITDGDEDGICLDRAAAPGSVIIVLRPGNDDQLGARVREEIFGGRDVTRWNDELEELVRQIVAMAGSALVEVKRDSPRGRGKGLSPG